MLLRYGNEVPESIKQFSKLKLSKARLANRQKFLTLCRNEKITPKGLNVSIASNFTKDKYIEKQRRILEATIVRRELQNVRKQLSSTVSKIQELDRALSTVLSVEDYLKVTRITEASREKEFVKVRERQIRKLKQYRFEKREKQRREKIHETAREQPTRNVFPFEIKNLSSSPLDADVESYLKLGPNFAVAPSRIPMDEIMVETERIAKGFEKKARDIEELATAMRREPSQDEKQLISKKKRDAFKIRKEVQEVLSKTKDKVEQNLTETEMKGRQKILKDKQKVYSHADKGKCMVVMDKEGGNSYSSRMKKVIEDQKGEKLASDPTPRLERQATAIIKRIVQRQEMTAEKAEEILQPKSTHSPRMFGLTKIHKPQTDYPLRPVVSCIDSPFSKISRHLCTLLQKLLGRSGTRVKNSRDLKSKMRNWIVMDTEILVSYDVEALYPSIPIKKAIDLIIHLIEGNEEFQAGTPLSVQSIKELLDFCLCNSYFEYNSEWYKLECGMIGLDLTGVIADIYMEDFEMRAISTSENPPSAFYRYVDDCMARMHEGRDQAEQFLTHINDMEPEIKFTMETEENGVLPLLDLKVERSREDHQLEFDVHYKKTNTNIQVKAKSNHPDHCKKAIIKGYADRNRNLCSAENLVEANRFVENVFVANGYKREEVKKAMEPKENQGDAQEAMNAGTVMLPYVKGLSEKLRRIYNGYEVRAAYRCGERIRDVGNRNKSDLGWRKNNVVYEIPCICGSIYIGQTERCLQTRMDEHERDIRLAKKDQEEGRQVSLEQRWRRSRLVKHYIMDGCDQNPDWDMVKVVRTCRGWMGRRLHETLQTKKRETEGKRTINEVDVNFHESWNHTLRRKR